MVKERGIMMSPQAYSTTRRSRHTHTQKLSQVEHFLFIGTLGNSDMFISKNGTGNERWCMPHDRDKKNNLKLWHRDRQTAGVWPTSLCLFHPWGAWPTCWSDPSHYTRVLRHEIITTLPELKRFKYRMFSLAIFLTKYRFFFFKAEVVYCLSQDKHMW